MCKRMYLLTQRAIMHEGSNALGGELLLLSQLRLQALYFELERVRVCCWEVHCP